MIKTAIVFDHRARTERGKEGPIEIRLLLDSKHYYINTGVRVRKEEWKCGSVCNRVDAPELNERLLILEKKVEKEINNYLAEGRAIDVAEIRKNLIKAETMARDDAFLEWAENESRTMVVSDGTRKHYATLLRRMYEFGKIRRWADLTVENIYEWDKWLHTLTKQQTTAERLQRKAPEPVSQSAVYNYHKNLKKLLNVAVKIGMIVQNPYERLKGEFGKGDKPRVDFLTWEEMQKIMNADLEPGTVATCRDLFVIQMFTGMAYADLMKFDINDYKEVDGKWIAVSERVKSGTAFIGQLLKPVVEVLKKYDYQIPAMSNQKYNAGLKRLAKQLDMNVRIYSHLGRHSFATMMLSKDVDIVNLSKMMGHTDIKQTLRYAKVLAKNVREDFNRIDEEL